jgi:HK97 family phage prohead protease
MNLETRAVPLDIQWIEKQDDAAVAEFEGMASTFGNVDLVGDVIERGAFGASLKKRPARRVRMLWQHDPDRPIGIWTEMQETDKGLRAKGQILLDVAQGRDAYALLKGGAIDSLSIGFRLDPKQTEYDDERRVRILKKIDLLEVSVVTFPANPKATISRVKHEGEFAEIREFERMLIEKGCSRSDAITIINEGYRALLVKRDADPETGDEGTRDAGLSDTIDTEIDRWRNLRKALRGGGN